MSLRPLAFALVLGYAAAWACILPPWTQIASSFEETPTIGVVEESSLRAQLASLDSSSARNRVNPAEASARKDSGQPNSALMNSAPASTRAGKKQGGAKAKDRKQTAAKRNAAKKKNAEQQAGDKTKKAAAKQQPDDKAKKGAARQQAGDKAKKGAAKQQAGDKAKKAAAKQQAGDKTKKAAAKQQADDKAKKGAAKQQAGDKAKKGAAKQQAGDKAKKGAAKQQAGDKAKKKAEATEPAKIEVVVAIDEELAKAPKRGDVKEAQIQIAGRSTKSRVKLVPIGEDMEARVRGWARLAGASKQVAAALSDRGAPLDIGKNYRLRVPAGLDLELLWTEGNKPAVRIPLGKMKPGQTSRPLLPDSPAKPKKARKEEAKGKGDKEGETEKPKPKEEPAEGGGEGGE